MEKIDIKKMKKNNNKKTNKKPKKTNRLKYTFFA